MPSDNKTSAQQEQATRRLDVAPEARAAVDDMRLDFVGETARRGAKYARRAASAARRRDRLAVHVRLRQARLCLQAVVEALEGQ